MTYKDALTAAMDDLAKYERTCFVGYGLKVGRAMGTLKNVPESQLVETPTAENLMTGIAIGMALKGRLPVVYFERMDFILNALDAIVNHLSALPIISKGEFSPAVIIRVTVGNRKKPLFTGHTHCQDFSSALEDLTDNIVVQKAWCPDDVTYCYDVAKKYQSEGRSTIVVEYKDLV